MKTMRRVGYRLSIVLCLALPLAASLAVGCHMPLTGLLGQKAAPKAAPDAAATGQLSVIVRPGYRIQALPDVISKAKFILDGQNVPGQSTIEIPREKFTAGRVDVRWDRLLPGPVRVVVQLFDSSGQLMATASGNAIVKIGQATALELAVEGSGGSVALAFVPSELGEPAVGAGLTFPLAPRGTWQAASPLSVARAGLSAVTLNGKVYVIGGDFNNLIEKFDPASGTWQTRSIPHVGIHDSLAAAAGIGNRIVMLGHDYEYLGAPDDASAMFYDPETFGDQAISPVRLTPDMVALLAARFGAAVVSDGESVYLLGGTSKRAANVPWPTPTAVPTAIPTSEPFPTPTPFATPTPFETPTPGVTPTPLATPTPDSSPTATPVPVPTFGSFEEELAFWGVASMSIGSTLSAGIDAPGEIDFFLFTLGSTAEVHGYTTGTTDTYSYMLDATGKVITQNDDAGFGTNTWVKATLATGSYYMKLRHYDSRGTGPYTLHVDFSGPTELDPTPGPSEAPATPGPEPTSDATPSGVFEGPWKPGPGRESGTMNHLMPGGLPYVFLNFGLLEALDTKTQNWRVLTPMPTARSALGASFLGGKLYAVGGMRYEGTPALDPVQAIPGVSANGATIAALSTLEVYDPVTDRWLARAPMPTARYGLAAVAAKGRLYAIGGADAGGNPLSVVESFDPDTNTWRPEPSLPVARALLGATTLSTGEILAIGGFGPDGRPLRSVDAFNPETLP